MKPFENVEHDVCLLIMNKNATEKLLCSTSFYDSARQSYKEKEWNVLKDEIIHKEFNYAYNLLLSKKDLNILNKIKYHIPINTYLQCHEGIHTGNAREILFKKIKSNRFCKPLFYGGGAGDNVHNYVSFRSGWYVDYRNDLIDKKRGYYASLRDEKIFKYPKIYITRTGNPFKAFLDEDN